MEVLLASLDTSLFPGISSSVQVHDGFKNEHAKTASVILAEVRTLMASKNTQNVMAVSTTFRVPLSLIIRYYHRSGIPLEVLLLSLMSYFLP